MANKDGDALSGRSPRVVSISTPERRRELHERRKSMTDKQILALLPADQSAGRSHVTWKTKCKYADCKGGATAGTDGYCWKHFTELYRSGDLELISPESPTQENSSPGVSRGSNMQVDDCVCVNNTTNVADVRNQTFTTAAACVTNQTDRRMDGADDRPDVAAPLAVIPITVEEHSVSLPVDATGSITVPPMDMTTIPTDEAVHSAMDASCAYSY